MLMLTRHAPRFVLGLFLVGGTPSALAAPVFQVIGGNVLERFDRSSSQFISDGSHIDGFTTDPSGGVIGSGALNSFAAAGPGVLRVDADSRITNISPTGAGGRNNADATASMTLDDVILSGPTGTLTTSFSIHLSGTLAAFNDSQPTSGASATVVLQLQGNGHLLNDSSATKNSGLPQVGVDLLRDFTGSDDLTSAPFTATANQAFTIVVRLGVLASSTMGSGDTGSVSADAHFSDTLTFVTDGPVFDLPTGYTANSISGNIVDNHFVPIPEPSTIMIGLPMLFMVARRRRTQR